MKTLKILFLVCALNIGATAQDTLKIVISVPELSGIAFNTYDVYKINGDTFYYSKSFLNPFDSVCYRKYVLQEKFKVDNIYLDSLKYYISKFTKADSSKLETSLCGASMEMGITRFFISFGYKDISVDCFVANVYREKYFRLVDVFNNIWVNRRNKGRVVYYKTEDLISIEAKCKGWSDFDKYPSDNSKE